MADDTERNRVIVLPPVAASVPAARRFARGALLALGVPHTEDAVALLVSELATNAVLHAGTPVRLEVQRRGAVLRVEVGDGDPTPPRPIDPDPLRLGGRGMFLVDTLAQRWGVTVGRQGKTVWFEVAA